MADKSPATPSAGKPSEQAPGTPLAALEAGRSLMATVTVQMALQSIMKVTRVGNYGSGCKLVEWATAVNHLQRMNGLT